MVHQSIYDFAESGFDAAYFSGSFMLMPDPAQALRHVLSLLKPGSRIYFTQTFEKRRAVLLEYTKPLFQYVTTIDFGQVRVLGSQILRKMKQKKGKTELVFLVC